MWIEDISVFFWCITNYYRCSGLNLVFHSFIISQFCRSESIVWLGSLLRISQGWSRGWLAVFSSRAQGPLLSSFLLFGRIQFLAAIGLRSRFSTWLLAVSCSHWLTVTLQLLLVTPFHLHSQQWRVKPFPFCSWRRGQGLVGICLWRAHAIRLGPSGKSRIIFLF